MLPSLYEFVKQTDVAQILQQKHVQIMRLIKISDLFLILKMGEKN